MRILTIFSLLIISACNNMATTKTSYWDSTRLKFPLSNLKNFAIDSVLEANYKKYPRLKNSPLDKSLAYGTFYLYSWQERDPAFNEFTIVDDEDELGLKVYYFVFNKKDSLLSRIILAGKSGEGGYLFETKSRFISSDVLTSLSAITTSSNDDGSISKKDRGDSTFSQISIDQSGKTNEEIQKKKFEINLEESMKKLWNDTVLHPLKPTKTAK